MEVFVGLVVSEGVFGLAATAGAPVIRIEVTIICFECMRANGEPGREFVRRLPLEAVGVVVMEEVMLNCGIASNGALQADGSRRATRTASHSSCLASLTYFVLDHRGLFAL